MLSSVAVESVLSVSISWLILARSFKSGLAFSGSSQRLPLEMSVSISFRRFSFPAMSKIVSQVVQLGLKFFKVLFDLDGHDAILLFASDFWV